ncbi:MAG: LysR family transcriptional regulator [Thermaurantiacus sp.]
MRTDRSLRMLRAFREIVETGTVTAAARRLKVSQPAVSRMLADLEAEIGFPLFYRDRGRLVLTPDGALLREEVGRALGTLERLSSLVRDIGEFRLGELRLVAPPSLAEGVIPEIASRLLGRHPGLRLSIDARSVETARTLIADRMVDGGFVKLPLDRSDLRVEPLLHSEAVCVMAADHPLATGAELDPATIGRASLILLGHGRASRNQIETAFTAAGVNPNVRVETHTVGSACALAARGVGLSIVNGFLAQPYLRDGLVTRPFRPRLPQDYALATAADVPPSRLFEAFAAEARAWIAEMAGSGAETRHPPVMIQPVAQRGG